MADDGETIRGRDRRPPTCRRAVGGVCDVHAMELTVQSRSRALQRYVFPITEETCFPKRGCLTAGHLVITFIHLEEIHLRSEFPLTGEGRQEQAQPSLQPRSSGERSRRPGEAAAWCACQGSEVCTTFPEVTAGLGAVGPPAATVIIWGQTGLSHQDVVRV